MAGMLAGPAVSAWVDLHLPLSIALFVLTFVAAAILLWEQEE